MVFVNTISHSKHSLFFQCREAYKHRYIEKYEGIPNNQDALSFGSYIHKIFEDGAECTHIKQLQKLADKHRATYKIPKNDSARTTICLQNFLKLNNKLKERSIGTEFKYEVDLTEGMTQNGVIDRIIGGEKGGILIIDYKTGKRQKTRLQLARDSQMLGYAYAAHKLYDVPFEQITCAHYYPLTNNLVTVRYGKRSVIAWKNKLIKDIWKMRKATKVDLYPMENEFCNWCNSRAVCSKFGEKNHLKREKLLTEGKKRYKNKKRH